MAIPTATPYARVRSSCLEYERGAVDYCRYRYACVLGDLQRELTNPACDAEALERLRQAALEADDDLSRAELALAQAEECA